MQVTPEQFWMAYAVTVPILWALIYYGARSDGGWSNAWLLGCALIAFIPVINFMILALILGTVAWVYTYNSNWAKALGKWLGTTSFKGKYNERS